MGNIRNKSTHKRPRRATQHKEATNMSSFWSNQSYSTSSSCLGRRFTNSNKKSSLITAMPESPSSNCHSHSHTTTNYSHYATEFSAPRNQRQGFGIASNVDNNNNFSSCFSDIDEWLEHANKFCKSSNHHLTESVHSRRNGSIGEDSRLSAICSTYFTAPEHELHNITLPSIREESPVFQGQNHLSCLSKAPKFGSHECTRLIRRQRPCDEFLDEVRRRKQEAEREACKMAKHVELMHRMRRKENTINDWELRQTRKAMDKMDKIQNELERKQFMASARTQRKICIVRERAEKQKLKLRRSTMKKFQQMQISETHSP